MTDQDGDDRGNWPAASAMEQVSLCPGSFRAQQGVAEEQMSFDALAGTRIHGYLEGQEIILNEGEQTIADELEQKREDVIAQFFPPPKKKGAKNELIVMKEHRLWLSPPVYPAPVNFSGKADHIVIKGCTALIMDYKTGRGEVAPSRCTLQLLALTVLLKENYPKLRKVCACIIQTGKPVEVATFNCKQIREGKALLSHIIELAKTPSSRRFAGEKQCKWCKYKTQCPEATGALITLAQVTHLSDPSKFAELLDYVGVAKKLIPEIESKAKEELAKNPNAISGYKIAPGVRRREIADSQQAFNQLLEDKLITSDEFIKAVKVSVVKLEAGVSKVTGKNRTQAFTAVADSLDELITIKEGKPRLVKD